MLTFLEKTLAKALEVILLMRAREAQKVAPPPKPIVTADPTLVNKAPPAAPKQEVLRKQMTLHLFFHGPRGVSRALFGARMTGTQVAGCERLIRAFDEFRPSGTLEQLAYILATSYHETGRRMQPVREAYGTSTEDTIAKLDAAFAAGRLTWVRTPYWREGWFGRGDVQLTHKANYAGPLGEQVKKRFDVTLVQNPDMALDPRISAYILIEGMTRGDTGVADFTSKPLEDFVNEKKTDYYGARATVNPRDWDTYAPIAQYAIHFEQALRSAGYEPANGQPTSRLS